MKSETKYPSPEIIRKRLDDILPHVEKPSRYFAGEIGSARKSWESVKARVVIAFPDVYEVASANLGHSLIQHIINSDNSYLAERVYAPWFDMEGKLRESQTPLFSLESFRAIADFDLIGFSLTHELNYSNVLLILDLSLIPLKASMRGFPIVIAGGPAAFNPEPMSEFIDAFVLGDGEDVVLTLVKDIADMRERIDSARGNIESEILLKSEILAKWGGSNGSRGIDGVYIPSHFQIEQDQTGRIYEIRNIMGGPNVIRKAVVKNLEQAPWIIKPFFSHIQKVSNRVTVEPARGCTHGCRFCQAGSIYRPYRMRSCELIEKQAENLLALTGQQELSFLALSVTDWPYLQKFISTMQKPGRDYHLRISLPSGRIAALTRDLTNLLISNRKGGLTLAIEAATPRLRAVINKDVNDEDCINAVENALISGWNLIKLYFMIGLPTETEQDIRGIIDLVRKLASIPSALRKKGESNVPSLKIKVSVSSFIPKPHTAFQWAKMDSETSLDQKQKLLTELRRIRGIEYQSHDIKTSRLEGVLARGDRRLAQVIMKAYQLGARFDAWGDQFKPELWEKAFIDSDIDPEYYLRAREPDEVFPWDHLSCGVSKEWLLGEWQRAQSGLTTPDCNETACMSCGISEIFPGCAPVRPGLD